MTRGKSPAAPVKEATQMVDLYAIVRRLTGCELITASDTKALTDAVDGLIAELEQVKQERDDAKQALQNEIVAHGNTIRGKAERLADDAVSIVRDRDAWREQAQQAAGVIAMIRAMLGEMFGPVIESEDATLLRGPEPKHDGEAILEALQKIAERLAGARVKEDSHNESNGVK